MKTDLLDRFKGFVETERLFQPGERLVVALSGGADSLAMVDLLTRIDQPVVLAHCNFRLRGEESDQDEEFVRKISVVYDVPLYVRTFDTVEYAQEKGISVEMAARELRYPWFEEIRVESSSSLVAVAHHSDDSLETMMINLIRGTGLRGLTGIQPRQELVVRPMLFTNRKEIIDYMAFRGLEYRNDSSNQDTRYIRNRIRHVLLPEMEKINPSFSQTVREEQLLFTQAQKIVEGWMGVKIASLVKRGEEELRIDIGALNGEEFREILLFEIIKPFGFHGRQVPKILAATENIPGKLFRSRTHTLVIDREDIIVSPQYLAVAERYYVDPESPDPELPVSFSFKIINDVTHYPPRDPNIACLDYEKLDLPLVLRRWEKGDYFFPLGMNHAKKVSDFFIDQKINRIEKDRTWILASGEQIVWILGHRIDNRFRITGETRYILEIKMMAGGR
ncbi:MAG: tRNA lysidine(34) synthetase TilS [Bacteroidales bacterium]|jgi:tRNA(Ile)-lysidine synthase